MSEEKRIYVVIPATVQGSLGRTVLQPHGRQIAQACHVVSKLRFLVANGIEPITTIILQARDERELDHVAVMLAKGPGMYASVWFHDTNVEAYGSVEPATALAVLATPIEVQGILDYLPLWGS